MLYSLNKYQIVGTSKFLSIEALSYFPQKKKTRGEVIGFLVSLFIKASLFISIN